MIFLAVHLEPPQRVRRRRCARIMQLDMSLNHELSDLFRNFAAILEIKGEPVFKAIAFSKVSRILKDMTFDIRQACEEGTLKEIEGLGASSCRIIEQYI